MRITFITASAVSLLKYLVLYSPFLWWCEMIKKHTWDEVRWMTQVSWLSIRLFLTFWQCIRRRIVCYPWSRIMEPEECWWWGGRSRRWVLMAADLGQEGSWFHHTTKEPNLKHVDCLFLEYSFLKFLDCSWLQVIETMESEITDKGRPLYAFSEILPCTAIKTWLGSFMIFFNIQSCHSAYFFIFFLLK